MRIVSIICFCLIFISCTKESVSIPEIAEYFGTIDVLKNQEVWSAKIGAYRFNSSDDKLGIYVHNYNSSGLLRGSLSIYKIPRSVGVFPITKTPFSEEDEKTGARYFSYIADGDVRIGAWRMDEADSLSSYIEITELDAVAETISGKFHIELKIDSSSIDQRINATNEQAETIFSEGEFFTKILE